MMRIERCPWCAKEIDRQANRYQKSRKTPGSRLTRFERCQHCTNLYGQRISGKQIVLHIIIFLLGICLLSLLSHILAFFAVFPFAILSCIWILSRPFQRMDENETPLPLDRPVLTATIVSDPSSDKKLRRNTLYFLSDDFDRYEAFRAVSPIYVHKVNDKTKEIRFSFLYDHPSNQEYIEHENIVLYDSQMLLIGEISTVR